MKESTKRALRTLYHALTGAVIAIPVVVGIILADLPVGETVTVILGTAVAAATATSKILNALEDKGLIPAWLKEAPTK